MRSVLYSRILIVLSFIGLYIAGTLSLSKFLNVSLPCGPANGCDVVNSHPSSYWGPIPVAYFGVAGYLILLSIGLIQAFQGVGASRKVTMLGYSISGIGAVISVGLQIYSRTEIGAICQWCFASAIVMVLHTVLYAVIVQNFPEQPLRPDAKWNILLPPILVIALLGGLGVKALDLSKSGRLIKVIPKERLEQVKLIPDRPNSFGSPNAKLTIVEFADLCCPTCQTSSPRVKDFVRQHEGNVRVIFRHFPLPMHKNSDLAAAVAEFAADKGKFWDFTLELMSLRKQDIEVDEIMTVARKVGLDVANLETRLQNDNDPIYDRITQDKNAANALGLAGTPTFYVMFPNGETRAYSNKSLFDALDTPELQKIVNGQ